MARDGLEPVLQGMQKSHTPAANDGAGDLDLFAAELDLFEAATIKPVRGRGRPPGSPNRTTVQLQKLLLAKGYRDPAEFQASLVTMDTAELALALSCSKLEAASLQQRAAERLMPYFHQAMPQAVELKGDIPRKLIVMGDVVQNIVSDQPLRSKADPPTIDLSHAELSHDGA